MRKKEKKVKDKFVQHTYSFEIPVFLHKITIVFSNDVVKARDKLDKYLGTNHLRGWAAMHSHDGRGHSWIILPFDAEGKFIAHEAWHCVKCMMDSLNAGLEDEIVAYSLSYVVDRIEQFQRQKGLRT